MLALIMILSTTALSGSITATAQVLGPPPTASATGAPPVGSAATFNPRTALEALQIRPVGELKRKKHHFETDAIMSDGRRVIVSFDLSGRLWEIEHAEHDKHRYGDGPINADSAVQAVRSAGFGNPSVREIKRNHTVVGAVTRNNEAVELHVDRGGVIYKQVWMR
jgi:hypothetical protein